MMRIAGSASTVEERARRSASRTGIANIQWKHCAPVDAVRLRWMLDVGRWMLDVFITAFLLHGEELHDVNRELHPSRNAPSGVAGQCPTSSAPCVGEFLFLHDVFAREDHIFAVSWNSSTISLSIGYFPRRVPLIAHTQTSLVPLSPSTARSCTSATLQPMRAVEIAAAVPPYPPPITTRS